MRNQFAKRWVITAGVALFASQLAHAAWVAEDANERWTMPIEGAWYGGSYYQITDVVAAAEDRGEGGELHIKILRLMSEDARTLDAILLHLEVLEDDSSSGSLIKINTTPAASAGQGFPAITELTAEAWERYAESLLDSTAGAVEVTLIQHQEDMVIGGNPVATAGFEIATESGQDRYDGNIIIYRPSGITSFNLSAPLDVAGFRLEEMWEMVRSIEFEE